MKNVVVTGVSTGIGLALARDLITDGYRVFGSVRSTVDVSRLAAGLGHNFVPLLFDVTDRPAIQSAAEQVREAVGAEGLFGLVNNAGIAVYGPAMHISLEEFRRQFEVNLFGALAVTQAFLPLLGAQLPQSFPPGRIVNSSSVRGKIVYPFFSPYAASKHALEALSHALRRELMIYGIDVIIVAPGSVVTPIWQKASDEDLSPYADTDYAEHLGMVQSISDDRMQTGITVETVSETVRAALESPRPKTRYALPRRWFMSWMLPRLLPDRIFDRLIASRAGLKRRG